MTDLTLKDVANILHDECTRQRADAKDTELLRALRVPESQGKRLYTWNWIGGGYNQTYAHSEEEAVEYAKTMSNLKPNMNTFKCCTEAEEKAYWDWFPLMD